jgi:hypothetical protein
LEVVGNVAGIEIKKPLKSLTVKGFKIPKSVRNKMRTPNPYTESVFDFLDKTTPNQSFLIENLSNPATGGASILVLVAIRLSGPISSQLLNHFYIEKSC